MPNMRRTIKSMLKHIGVEENHIIKAGDGAKALQKYI
jgi:hypothetical protein|tara:strand:- start:191 stop:301 length:111 start_codon:yes stop_codon:yes gene_type:complete